MKIKTIEQLVETVKNKEPKTIAVAVADDLEVLEVIEKAEETKLAKFILVGDEESTKEIIKEHGLNIDAKLIDEKDHKKAAELAVDLVTKGKADTIMKGMVQSAIFLRAVLNKEKGLNIGKRITQISVMEKEDGEGLRLITDCAITVAPNVIEKKEVLENAVSLAHKLGYEEPRVALLASVEVINPNMQDTLDAAVLSKMADRGQIKGCIVDGPFALDNAISDEAAKHKGVVSPVAGNADILVVPNLTVGNVLTKSISYIAKKTVVAATVGTAVPIVFTSRTESVEGKLLAIALASYVS